MNYHQINYDGYLLNRIRMIGPYTMLQKKGLRYNSNSARTNQFYYFTFFVLFCYFLNGAPYFSKKYVPPHIFLIFNAKRQSLAILVVPARPTRKIREGFLQHIFLFITFTFIYLQDTINRPTPATPPTN